MCMQLEMVTSMVSLPRWSRWKTDSTRSSSTPTYSWMKNLSRRILKSGFTGRWIFLSITKPVDSRVSELTDAEVKFGLIPHEHWFQPDWIDEAKAKASREDMVKNNVIYGGEYDDFFWHVATYWLRCRECPVCFLILFPRWYPCLIENPPNSYRNMCRFNSGVCHLLNHFRNSLTWLGSVLLEKRASQGLQVLLAVGSDRSRFHLCCWRVIMLSELSGLCQLCRRVPRVWSKIYRPDVKFFCDLDYDPFLIMQDQKKVYGAFSVVVQVWRHVLTDIS